MSITTSWTRPFFALHPVFRTEQFIAAAPSNEQSARDLIKHYRRTGRLVSIRTGMWFVPSSPDDVPDPIAVAGSVAADAIVGMHAAMQVHGAGYSMHSTATVFTASRIRPFEVSGVRIQAVPHPRSLVTSNQILLETDMVHRLGSSIRVTSRERSLVDMLDRQELNGGIEEVWRTARQLGWLDGRRLLAYLAARDSPTLYSRVGYLAEHEPQLDIADDVLEQLRSRVVAGGRGPWQFAPHASGAREFDAAWRMLVPERATPSHWEEPGLW